MTYVFRCPECGHTVEQAVRDPAPMCVHGFFDKGVMQRDYRAEGVAVNLRGLR